MKSTLDQREREPSSVCSNSSGMETCAASGVLLSVIIPVRNDPEHLRVCLQHLSESQFQEYEVVVVDDSSTDSTAEMALQFPVRLLRLSHRCGPAAARNHGARAAEGKYLFFIDADVCVHTDTLGMVIKAFQQNPSIDALFGSYDVRPAAKNIISQYKNLFHHFVHQASLEEASTFWSGCGAIKRSVFLECGGFDTSYRRPCIEDIELGVRLRKAGHRIALKKHIQTKHLKRWTMWSLLKTDVWDRGVPWTELMLREGHIPNDLNLRYSQRISVLVASGLLLMLLIAVAFWPGLLVLFAMGLLAIQMLDRWSLTRSIPKSTRILAVLGTCGTLVFLLRCFPLWTLTSMTLALGLVALNYPFYRFLAMQRQPLFAAVVVPLHVTYYLYSGLAFGIGLCLYLAKATASWHGYGSSGTPRKSRRSAVSGTARR